MEEINHSIALLNKAGEAGRKRGFKVVYHNEINEFKPVEGKIPYELFLEGTKHATINMELDIAWCIKAGADPIVLFKKYPGRFPLWHVKDLNKEMNQVLPLGEGMIDYTRIFSMASAAGLQYYFIEHDMPDDAFKSIETSARYLKKKIY